MEAGRASVAARLTSRSVALLATVLGALAMAPAATAQTPEPPRNQPVPARPVLADEAIRTATPAEESAVLSYANRPVVIFRAKVLGRSPAQRAAAAVTALDRLIDEMPRGRAGSSALAEARVISIDGQPVFAILPQDVDPLTGETVDGAAAATASRLQVAFDEAVELRDSSRLLWAGFLALCATVVFALALALLARLHRATALRIRLSAERQLARLPGGEVIATSARAPVIVRRALIVGTSLIALILANAWLTFVLRRFPYTRPWGETLRGSILNAVLSFGRMAVDALPGLFVVLIVVLMTRLAGRVANLLFEAIEQGRVSFPGVYPETAQPTRRIVIALLWVLALVVSYGYLPGSDSEAFKGISVFIGLMISLGSTGIMNQIMSGLTITYSRSLRLGDFVKVGDVEGTVVHLGSLATKIKTPRREEVTIPNAVVVSNSTTNYSRLAETEGVLVPTSVTIGYDTPWRQVHALLLLAAERTSGIRVEPKPLVLQTALQDFYVQYTLLVSLDRPDRRAPALAALHANIQDAFNEFGVQIMSPNYEADPTGPKVVPRNQWYAAPASPDGGEARAASPALAPLLPSGPD
jgi:small-conductance mechanosensitive channel